MSRDVIAPAVESPEIPLDFQRIDEPGDFLSEYQTPQMGSPAGNDETFAEVLEQIIEALRNGDDQVADDANESDDAFEDHGARHTDGSDNIDGDQVVISWTPSNITPDTTPSEVDEATDLTAILAGIDDRFKGTGLNPGLGGDLTEYDHAPSSGAQIIPTHAYHRVVAHPTSPEYLIRYIDGTNAAAGDVLTLRFESGKPWKVQYHASGNINPMGGQNEWEFKAEANECQLVFNGTSWNMVTAGYGVIHKQDWYAAYTVMAAQATADAPTAAALGAGQVLGREGSGVITGLSAGTLEAIMRAATAAATAAISFNDQDLQDIGNITVGDGNTVGGSTAYWTFDDTDSEIQASADVGMNGYKICFNAASTTFFQAISDTQINATVDGDLNMTITKFSNTFYKNTTFRDGVRAIFGNAGDATIGWETAEATDTLKFFAKTGAFIFSQFTGNAGLNKYGASPPPAMSLVVQADDTVAAHRIQLGHDTTDAFIDSITGDLKLKIAGAAVVSVEAAKVVFSQELDLGDNDITDVKSLVFNDGGATVDIIRDEDDMASDDDEALATQQSIKAYVDASGGGIKTAWFLVAYRNGSPVYNTAATDYPTAEMSSAGIVNFAGVFPADFTSITKMVVVMLPDASETVQADLSSQYAGEGEAYNTHGEDIANAQLAVTSGQMEEFDVSGVFDAEAPAAGDYFGLEFASDTSNLRVIGLRLDYT